VDAFTLCLDVFGLLHLTHMMHLIHVYHVQRILAVCLQDGRHRGAPLWMLFNLSSFSSLSCSALLHISERQTSQGTGCQQSRTFTCCTTFTPPASRLYLSVSFKRVLSLLSLSNTSTP